MGIDLYKGKSPNFLQQSAQTPEDCQFLQPWMRDTLTVTGFTMMALMILNLIFLINNLVRYIIPLRIKLGLIISFYALASI